MKWNLGRGLVAVSLAVHASAEVAVAFPNEPHGFGPLRFGMSVAAVKKHYPAVRPKTADTFLAFYDLENQSVLGLKPCNLEMRFVDDKLYDIQFQCEPRTKVPETLKRRFGEAYQVGPAGTFWIGSTSSVGLNARSNVFAFTHRALNDVVQQKMLHYLATQSAPRQSPGVAPAPAPTASAP